MGGDDLAGCVPDRDADEAVQSLPALLGPAGHGPADDSAARQVNDLRDGQRLSVVRTPHVLSFTIGPPALLWPCADASPAGNPAATASPAAVAAANPKAHREFFIHSPRSFERSANLVLGKPGSPTCDVRAT
jgi:hypothetical protein